MIAAAKRPVKVLNLFGYTGLASLVAARAGAEVTHVDASKKAIGWARENQEMAGLGGKPIRWMIPKEGALVGMVSLHIAPKTKNLELCKKFVNFAISKEANEGFCNTVMAGQTNKLSTLAEPALSRVPKLDSIIFPDWYKIVKNAPKWIERWNREITG